MILNANQLKDFTLEISDREIYNDIRAECDVTEILTVRPDATPELFLSFEASAWAEPVPKNSTLDIIATADEDHSEIVWLEITEYSFHPETIMGWGQGACEQLGGIWNAIMGTTTCRLPQSTVEADMEWEIIKREDTTCTIRVTNNSDYDVRGVWKVAYLALTPETRYIKLRSINQASIDKYGRRAMDLVWPLGITPNTMQSLIDNYCARYCEPVSLASMTLEGETDTKIGYILNMRIDDKHEIIHPGLSMDEEFFVNNLSVSFNREGTGVLTGTFGLEQVRDMEKPQLFTLDVSYLSPAIAPHTDDVLGS